MLEKSQLLRPMKDKGIETLRGCAIFFVVIGHVFGGIKYATNNNDPLVNQLLLTSQTLLKYLIMPLFTVIAGYVYAIRTPKSLKSFFPFTVKKINRILIPCYVASTLFFLGRCFVEGANHKEMFSFNILAIYYHPYAHYWYLFAIFWIFIVAFLLDTIGLFKSFYSWLALLLFSIVFSLNKPAISYFGLDSSQSLFPFFIIGCGLNFYKEFFTNFKAKALLVSIAIFSVLINMTDLYFFNISISKLCWLMFALSFLSLMFIFRFTINPLSYLGSYSYSIYLYHSFASASFRILLIKFGINSYPVHLFVGLIMGVLLPILFEKAIKNYRILGTLFLGQKIYYSNHKLWT